MRLFHISDVLSVITGRLVSNRHMVGVYDILNFLTGDQIYTHQIPRVMRECIPWLKTQFPQLFVPADLSSASPGNALMVGLLHGLDSNLKQVSGDRSAAIADWVDAVRTAFELPEELPVYEMPLDMHTSIDPAEELRAMVGDEKVIVIKQGESDGT